MHLCNLASRSRALRRGCQRHQRSDVNSSSGPAGDELSSALLSEPVCSLADALLACRDDDGGAAGLSDGLDASAGSLLAHSVFFWLVAPGRRVAAAWGAVPASSASRPLVHVELDLGTEAARVLVACVHGATVSHGSMSAAVAEELLQRALLPVDAGAVADYDDSLAALTCAAQRCLCDALSLDDAVERLLWARACGLRELERSAALFVVEHRDALALAAGGGATASHLAHLALCG